MVTSCQIPIWHWPLIIADEEQRGSLLNLLEKDEVARANRLRSATHRDEFIAARAGLRILLAKTLDEDPSELRFTYGKYGRPSLDKTAHRAPLSFNLAHSGNFAVLTVSRTAEVGIDIERLRDIDLDIAKRFFTETEFETISKAPVDQRQALFFRCWTLKEAILKATGDGIQRGLDTFAVSLVDQPPITTRAPNQPHEDWYWSLSTFTLSENYIGAVALAINNISLTLDIFPWELPSSR